MYRLFHWVMPFDSQALYWITPISVIFIAAWTYLKIGQVASLQEKLWILFFMSIGEKGMLEMAFEEMVEMLGNTWTLDMAKLSQLDGG